MQAGEVHVVQRNVHQPSGAGEGGRSSSET